MNLSLFHDNGMIHNRAEFPGVNLSRAYRCGLECTRVSRQSDNGAPLQDLSRELASLSGAICLTVAGGVRHYLRALICSPG